MDLLIYSYIIVALINMSDSNYVLNAVGIGTRVGSGTLKFADAIGTAPDEVLSSMYNPSSFGSDIMNQVLTGNELKYFAAWYYNNFVIPTQDSLLRDFFDSKFANALLALLHAKHSFNQGTYGVFGKGSIFAQQIRPVTVYASGGTVVENWLQSNVTAGWNSKVFNVALNTTNTTGALNLANNVEMLVLGFGDFNASSKLFEIRPAENGTNPIGVRSHTLIRSPITEKIILLDQTIEIPINGVYTFDGNYAAGGASEPFLSGIQFVTQTYVNQE